MKPSIYFLLIIVICFFSTGCNKCTEHKIAVLQFTPKEQLINPYNGHEALIFRNLNGDSINLIGQGRSSNFTNRHEHIVGNSSDCPGDFISMERDLTVFLSKDNLWQFVIILSYDFSFTDLKSDNTLLFDEYTLPLEKNPSISGAQINFETDTIFDNYYNHRDTLLQFHKSISLGLKTFNDIYEILLVEQIYGNGVWATTLYYSIKQGIVGFRTTEDELWYLDNKNI